MADKEKNVAAVSHTKLSFKTDSILLLAILVNEQPIYRLR